MMKKKMGCFRLQKNTKILSLHNNNLFSEEEESEENYIYSNFFLVINKNLTSVCECDICPTCVINKIY